MESIAKLQALPDVSCSFVDEVDCNSRGVMKMVVPSVQITMLSWNKVLWWLKQLADYLPEMQI